MLTLTVSSQETGNGRTPEERAQIQNEWMQKALNLNEEQQKKVSSINLEYAVKMEKIRAISGKAEKLRTAKELDEEKEAKLRPILTEEQFSVYLKEKYERRQKARQNYRNR